MHRDTDGAALVGDRTRHRLANPPGRVRRKFIAALILELVDRAHQADIAFLNQIEKAEAAIGVALGEADDEAQIRFCEFLFGAAALVLAGGDDLELVSIFLTGGLRFLFDFANVLLRLTNASGDIEQVFAHVIDLEHVAAIFGLGRFFQQMRTRAAGGLFVAQDRLNRLAVLAQVVALLADDGFHQAAREL